MITGGLRTNITSGTYTGNDSANRAIPHGLGVPPKLVLIERAVANTEHNKLFYATATVFYNSGANENVYAVTIADTTNFYVGNIGDWTRSANGAGVDFRWIAFG